MRLLATCCIAVPGAPQEFNGNGSTTTFTLNQAVTKEDIIVSVDGVVQESDDAFTVPTAQP